ncbi:MAG: nicotinamide phosphoribosyltransferase, partial [Mucilaginibacter sp.]|nr:nicotinamide phosphoribosyltransferase [Mucilaginibacter sp.]
MLKFITCTDGYKVGHKPMFDALGIVEYIYSNFTPRGSRIKGQEKVILLGLQYLLQEFFMDLAQKTFFDVPKQQVLDYYQRRLDGYLGPNTIGVEHIAALHDLGYIPLEFYAVPEGTHVKLKQPMFTIENTHPDFYWVTNYFETLISDVLWQPCTSATTAYRYNKILTKYAKLTGGNLDLIQYQAHNFSMRGMVLPEGAAVSDMGHISVFTGSDTLPTIDLIEDYYTCKGLIAA